MRNKLARFLIEEQLSDAGWKVGTNSQDTDEVKQEVKVDGQPTETGIGFADYVLFDTNGKPLAVIEAKKTSKDVEIGKTQAKLYADSLEKKYNQRPVIFLLTVMKYIFGMMVQKNLQEGSSDFILKTVFNI